MKSKKSGSLGFSKTKRIKNLKMVVSDGVLWGGILDNKKTCLSTCTGTKNTKQTNKKQKRTKRRRLSDHYLSAIVDLKGEKKRKKKNRKHFRPIS